MAVAFVDDECAVKLLRLRAHRQLAGLRAEPHRAALFCHALLIVQHRDDRMRRGGVEFGRVRFREFQNIPREFNRRDLHSEAKAEIGDFIFARELRRENFSFHAALAETARHENSAEAVQHFFRTVFFDFLGVHLHDFHAAIVADAAVDDRLVNRFVGVLQADVFADDADAHAMLRRDEFADDFLPVRHVRDGRVEMQKPANQIVHALALQHQRHFVNGMVNVFFLDDGFERDVAK